MSQRMLSDRGIELTGPEMQLEKNEQKLIILKDECLARKSGVRTNVGLI